VIKAPSTIAGSLLCNADRRALARGDAATAAGGAIAGATGGTIAGRRVSIGSRCPASARAAINVPSTVAAAATAGAAGAVGTPYFASLNSAPRSAICA
jgi:hypothetical protein